MSTRSHARSIKAAHINVSLSKDDLTMLDEMAKKEGRTRSNMFQMILRRMREEHPSQEQKRPFQVSSSTNCPAKRCVEKNKSAS